MNKLSGMLLAVLFLVTANAWGACVSKTATISISSNCTYAYNECNEYTCKVTSDTPYNFKGGCSQPCTRGRAVEVSGISTKNTDVFAIQSCRSGDGWSYVELSGLYCATQVEADSANCVNDGGTWVSDGSFCKFSSCLQSDTLWLNDSKAACDAIGGENNYAIADIDETCVHSGICCPRDSALVGNTCKWRCDSLYAACTAKNGYLYAGVLQDTTISGSDSTFTNKCYYNCSYAYNKDSTTSVTDGNTACSSPSTPIADCTRMPNDFSSVRTTYGDSVYSYDFLTPGSAAYIDSIVLTPCSRFMYRCTVNGKYKYWYSDADIPTGCTNIVKIK